MKSPTNTNKTRLPNKRESSAFHLSACGFGGYYKMKGLEHMVFDE